MKNKRITILLIITNIILIGIICSLISKNGNIIKEKQIIKEMNENTQVTELNNQINALNTEHTEYLNYIQTCKTKIATALENEGVTTSNDATLEAMSENISKIFKTRTSDATATADNISAGKTAYVNGELITGNGADNTANYNSGKADAAVTIPSIYLSGYLRIYTGNSGNENFGGSSSSASSFNINCTNYNNLKIGSISGSVSIKLTTASGASTTIGGTTNVVNIAEYSNVEITVSSSTSMGSAYRHEDSTSYAAALYNISLY